MKTVGMIMLVGSLLVACSPQKKEEKGRQPEMNNVEEAVDRTDSREEFRETELTYPGSTVAFKVSVKGNELFVEPSGLSVSNEAFRHDITGYTVNKAEIGDLNLDGYPEVFVYLTSHGSGSYGKLIGYSVNNGKSASLVHLPDITEDEAVRKGYMGHDEMAIVESTFCRRFPVYEEKDSNSQPSGKIRQIQYKLVDGESGRMLKIDKVLEF